MRLRGLDIFRGVATIFMVVYHFSFDLNNFHYIDVDLLHETFWKYFRYIIVSMFVFASGLSLYLTHAAGFNRIKLKKHLCYLGVAALLVSLGSYVAFPKSWIYFGIIHFLFISSLVGLLFLHHRYIALVSAIFIIAGFKFSFLSMHWLYLLLYKSLHLPIYYTQDLANIVPWFGVYLLGVSAGGFHLHKTLFEREIFEKKSQVMHLLATIGKHTLIIYLLHQPILFTLFILIDTILF